MSLITERVNGVLSPDSSAGISGPWFRRASGIRQFGYEYFVGQKVEDHFVDVTELIEIGKGGQRAVRTVFPSRYAWVDSRDALLNHLPREFTPAPVRS
jgi:hypothetical protein